MQRVDIAPRARARDHLFRCDTLLPASAPSTLSVIAFSVAASDVAVTALVNAHPANRSTAHPSAANPSLHRALGQSNGAAHVRPISRRHAATTGASPPAAAPAALFPWRPQLRSFVQSGFYEVARYNARIGRRTRSLVDAVLGPAGSWDRQRMWPLCVVGLIGSGDATPLEPELLYQADRPLTARMQCSLSTTRQCRRRGERSVSVAPQYASSFGKTTNCQTLVSLTLARGEELLMVALRLFLHLERYAQINPRFSFTRRRQKQRGTCVKLGRSVQRAM